MSGKFAINLAFVAGCKPTDKDNKRPIDAALVTTCVRMNECMHVEEGMHAERAIAPESEVKWNGDGQQFFFGNNIEFYESFELNNFPFDVQYCSIPVVTWHHKEPGRFAPCPFSSGP